MPSSNIFFRQQSRQSAPPVRENAHAIQAFRLQAYRALRTVPTLETILTAATVAIAQEREQKRASPMPNTTFISAPQFYDLMLRFALCSLRIMWMLACGYEPKRGVLLEVTDLEKDICKRVYPAGKPEAYDA